MAINLKQRGLCILHTPNWLSVGEFFVRWRHKFKNRKTDGVVGRRREKWRVSIKTDPSTLQRSFKNYSQKLRRFNQRCRSTIAANRGTLSLREFYSEWKFQLVIWSKHRPLNFVGGIIGVFTAHATVFALLYFFCEFLRFEKNLIKEKVVLRDENFLDKVTQTLPPISFAFTAFIPVG